MKERQKLQINLNQLPTTNNQQIMQWFEDENFWVETYARWRIANPSP